MQKHSQEKPFRLITIPISHYCEKVRWALDRLNIPYIEEGHAPLFHRLATSPRGGSSVPLLVTEAGTFTDSTDILHYLDGLATSETKLYPADPQLCREVEKLEDLFDTQLGTSIRSWIYFYVLDNRQLIRQLWSEGVPAVEQTLLPLILPLGCSVIRRTYNITAESGANSYNKIKHIFETVNEQLADGRSYLVGDTFSAADLTFACLAAPLLRPNEHPVKSTQLDELPEEMVAIMNQLQETPAGVYGLRLFREERYQKEVYIRT